MERVTMPQLGETVTEGTIVRWLKQAGDDGGRRRRAVRGVHRQGRHRGAVGLRRVPARGATSHEGDTVPIGTLLAVVTDTADEAVERHRRPARRAARAAAAPAGRHRARRDRRGRAVGAVRRARGRSARPRRPSLGRERLPVAGRAAAAGRARSRRPARSWARAATGASPGPTCWPRREPRSVHAAAPCTRRRRRRRRRSRPTSPQPGPDDEVIEFSRARRTTADHMMRSLATSAHTLVVVEVDYARRRRRCGARPGCQLPAVRRPGRRRRPRRVPPRQRPRRRRRADRAPPHPPRRRRRPRLRGPRRARCVQRRRRQAPAGPRRRDRRPGPAGPDQRLTADDLTGGTFTITNVGELRHAA